MDWSETNPINTDTWSIRRLRAEYVLSGYAKFTKEDADIYSKRLRGERFLIFRCDSRDASVMLVLTRLAQKGIKPVARPLASHLGH